MERFIKVIFPHGPPIVVHSPLLLSRRSLGLRWTPTRTPGGRLAWDTSRLMTWFWLDFNMCRRAHGSATSASTDPSNCHAWPVMPHPARHHRFLFSSPPNDPSRRWRARYAYSNQLNAPHACGLCRPSLLFSHLTHFGHLPRPLLWVAAFGSTRDR